MTEQIKVRTVRGSGGRACNPFKMDNFEKERRCSEPALRLRGRFYPSGRTLFGVVSAQFLAEQPHRPPHTVEESVVMWYFLMTRR